MKVTTFRIRRRIIQSFLFCVLAILIFAGLSFQAHWEMGKRLRLVERLEGIIRESVRPMERIEGIKILHVEGLGGGTAAPDGGAGFADSVVNSALRFRAQAPLVDQLLREIGIGGGELGKIAQNLSAAALPSAQSE